MWSSRSLYSFVLVNGVHLREGSNKTKKRKNGPRNTRPINRKRFRKTNNSDGRGEPSFKTEDSNSSRQSNCVYTAQGHISKSFCMCCSWYYSSEAKWQLTNNLQCPQVLQDWCSLQSSFHYIISMIMEYQLCTYKSYVRKIDSVRSSQET